MTAPDTRRQRRLDLASAILLAAIIIVAFAVDRPDQGEPVTVTADVCTEYAN